MKKKSTQSKPELLEIRDMDRHNKTETIEKGFLSNNLYDVDVIAWRSERKKALYLGDQGSATLEYFGAISFSDKDAHMAFGFRVDCDNNKLLDQTEKDDELERLNNLQRLVNEFVEQAKKDIEYCDEVNAMRTL